MASLVTEVWERDDNWTVTLRHDGETVVYMDHMPQINTEPPNPVTYEYAVRAMSAHGYVKKTEAIT